MTAIQPDMKDLSAGNLRSFRAARPWRTKARTAAAVAMVLGAASVSLARDSGPPSIDIEKLCRGGLEAMREVFTNGDEQGLGTCVADEQAAREELVKNWTTYPASAKAACLRPQEYLPGYVEWQTCLEMAQGVLDLHKREAPEASTTGSGASRQPAARRGRSAGN
jgi:hypothetical protein